MDDPKFYRIGGNRTVKCSGDEINMADCIQLTQGGVYADRAESVTVVGGA